ncbi:MAG: hypothetical protein JWR07_2079 [Nevskia sp.]|nr:hypothetical protein [Nevskia sp.]
MRNVIPDALSGFTGKLHDQVRAALREGLKKVGSIHWNPVKHGYIRQAAIHRYARSGVYAEDWGGVPDMTGDFGE